MKFIVLVSSVAAAAAEVFILIYSCYERLARSSNICPKYSSSSFFSLILRFEKSSSCPNNTLC